MTVLVDTSIWIDLFRSRKSPGVDRLKSLVGREEILLGDLILAETLQGIRSEPEARAVSTAFSSIRVVPLVGEPIARQSAENYRLLRRQGVTVRKTIDCLIATWCIKHEVPLLHSDHDFGAFRVLGLIEA